MFDAWLHIPYSVYYVIKSKYSDEAQRVQGWCEWYLTHHPAQSWLQVANALYCNRDHDILDVLRSQVYYLKGGSHKYLTIEQSCQHSCMQCDNVSPKHANGTMVLPTLYPRYAELCTVTRNLFIQSEWVFSS